MEVLRLGLALLADGEQSRERATLLSELGKKRMLQARFAEAEEYAARGDRRGARDRRPRGGGDGAERARHGAGRPRRRRRGRASCCASRSRSRTSAASDGGGRRVDQHRRRPAPRRAHGGGARGRARRASSAGSPEPAPHGRLAAARGGRVQLPPRRLGRGRGRDPAAEPPPHGRHASCSGSSAARGSRSAAATSTRAEDAMTALDRAPRRAPPSRSSSAPYGVLRSELARRRRRPRRARGAAVDEALDRIEYCSDDMAPDHRSWPPPGCAWRATPGQLARDRRDAEAESRARARADTLLERARLAAASGGPVEEAELATAEAEYARATGADGAEPSGRRPPRLGAARSAPTRVATRAGARRRR